MWLHVVACGCMWLYGGCVCAVQKVELPAEKKSVQKSVDSAIEKKLDAATKAYLRAKFTLTKGQYPHAMSF
jgi:hypothetical protein